MMQMLKTLVGERVGKDEMEAVLKEAHDDIKSEGKLDSNKDGHITKEEFVAWYRDSMFWTRAAKQMEEEDDLSEPLSIAFPDCSNTSVRAYVFFLLAFPIIAAMLMTIPDVRRTDERLCGIRFP